MDFTGDAKLPTFAYELGAQAASQVKLVGWLPGDEFDGLRKESQPWERKAPPPQPRGNCLVSLSTNCSERIPKPFSPRSGGPVLFFLLFRVSRLCLLANFCLLLWCQHIEQLTDFEALVPLEHRLFRLRS